MCALLAVKAKTCVVELGRNFALRNGQRKINMKNGTCARIEISQNKDNLMQTKK